ncbi:glycosyltransferase family 2 protein [Skermania piniformis]|uniref:Glycosyltransferase family 2 protein n=1 Tax=Skermania pinensis TaxID=39122 RepID=A0ABX8SAK8_9ACTN|nr:glycosyltransferase family 2 protein [Skermania piniformis]QXQ14898.1 glycosyltransferase family 2 protein [Skermania piniformis]
MSDSASLIRTAFGCAVLAAFFMPYLEAFLVTVGEWWYHTSFRTAHGKYTRLVVQITTVGRERDRVVEIISRIRAYRLPIDYQIWVVLEPGHTRDYPGADFVFVVPEEFACSAVAKARAQEYSRLMRERCGMSYDPGLKLLFLDDDVEPTREYIMLGFAADYDVCQGVTAPRIHYGRRGVKHFLLSHMDDMRFLACLVWCSFTQGVLRRPVYAHGEGLFMTARAERTVTWNYPIYASEDLVVGQNAAALGLSWGWFHEYIELTSPWTWTDYLTQRRRWLWGNIHAVTHRGILPGWGRVFVVARYLLGAFTFAFSLLGLFAILMGWLHLDGVLFVYCWGALVAWIFSFAVTGWVSSGRRPPSEAGSPASVLAERLFQSMAAVVLAVTLITPAWTVLALLLGLIKGNPRGFQTIAKTEQTARAAALRNSE